MKGVADFYATSWALSHYLLLSPEGRREMSRLVEQLSRGVSPEEAQRLAFGRSPEKLEAELRAHVAHLARGVPAEVVFDAQALALRGAGRPAALSVADAACELGLLALQLAGAGGEARERALAKRLLEMAAADGAPRARCQAALAEALALAGKAKDAKLALQQALTRAPDDPRVQVHAGRAELARAEAAETHTAADALEAAEGHFRRALTLDPGSASAWFGLGRCLEQAARPDEALVALRKARRFGWSSSLDLALGGLELERGNTQQAVDLLWPLVQDPHGGPACDEAAKLLEQAGLLPETANGEKL
jgi:Flp pilus assembly protein TadD